MVNITSSTRKANALYRVGHTSGRVVLPSPIFRARPTTMNLASTRALTMARPQGANSTPAVCSTAVFIAITEPRVM